MDFHDLYARYAADVHRFALYLSCDPAMADDITSEAFLRAWSSAAPIREATVKAYLFTIARHVYLHELRRSARHVALEDRYPLAAPSQEERVTHQSSLHAVLRGLRTLPEIERAALLMRSHDGMSYEAIAQALDLTLSNVKIKIHRARLKLAALLPETT